MSSTISLFCLTAVMVLFFSSASADSDWEYGVFVGPVTDLFNHQPKQVVDFVTAHMDLASNARNYLTPCDQSTGDNLCALNQPRFVLDFVGAFYGDHNSQQNVSYLLSGDGAPPKLLDSVDEDDGIKSDVIWGCAWRMATLTGGSHDVDMGDLDMYKVDCLSLSESEQGQAEGIAAGFLVPRIDKLMSTKGFPYSLVDDFPASP